MAGVGKMRDGWSWGCCRCRALWGASLRVRLTGAADGCRLLVYKLEVIINKKNEIGCRGGENKNGVGCRGGENKNGVGCRGN